MPSSGTAQDWIDATPAPGETVHQQRLIARKRSRSALAAMPELAFLHSVPNSTKTSKWIAGRMKREGVERGVFDLLWDLRRSGWAGLRIEMKKSREDGRVSKEQKEFAAHYAAQGFLAVRCNDDQEAWKVITWYYGLPCAPHAPGQPLPASLAHCACPTEHKARPRKGNKVAR